MFKNRFSQKNKATKLWWNNVEQYNNKKNAFSCIWKEYFLMMDRWRRKLNVEHFEMRKEDKKSPKKIILNHIKHKNAVGVHSTCFLLLFFLFFGKKESTKWLARHDRNTFCRYKGQQKELKNVFHIIGLLVRISVHIYIKIVVISFWFFFMLHKNKKKLYKDRRSKGQHKCIFMLILLKLVLSSTWWWWWRWCVYA